MSPDREPYVVLLRGINVGKSARIAMADLRAALTAENLDVVATVLQSGNLLANWARAPGELARLVSDSVERHFGVKSPAIVRSSSTIEALIGTRAFPEASDLTRLTVHFADPRLDRRSWNAGEAATLDPSCSRFVSGEVFQWCPDGISNAPILAPRIEREFRVTVTVRNVRTLTRIVEAASKLRD